MNRKQINKISYEELQMQRAVGTISMANFIDIVQLTHNKQLLKILSSVEDSNVRASIAKNKNCPINVLIHLSKDKDWYVRYWVAANNKCPIKILTQLSTDSDGLVNITATYELERKQHEVIKKTD